MRKFFEVFVVFMFVLSINPKPTWATDDLQSISKSPIFKVGDSFTYRGYRSLDDAMKGRDSIWGGPMEVKEVKESGNVLFVVNDHLGNYRILNRDGNMIERKVPGSVLQKYEPSLEEHKYPLVVGDGYDVKSVYNPPDPDRNRQEFSCSGKGKVVGWETVTVPAGTFKSLKVEVSGLCNIRPAGWSSSFVIVKWLAPEIKMRPILYREDRYWAGGKSDYTYSLHSYSLK